MAHPTTDTRVMKSVQCSTKDAMPAQIFKKKKRVKKAKKK